MEMLVLEVLSGLCGVGKTFGVSPSVASGNSASEPYMCLCLLSSHRPPTLPQDSPVLVLGCELSLSPCHATAHFPLSLSLLPVHSRGRPLCL